MDKAYDLFMLMFNLSQLHSEKRIVSLFIKNMNEIFSPVIFEFTANPTRSKPDVFEVKTAEVVYGYMETEIPSSLSKDKKELIANAIQMLAMILENVDLNSKLKRERDSFEEIANQRMEELKLTVRNLERARSASINLIEDLTNEIGKRVEIENTLRESEEKYRRITENINDVVWTADLNLKIKYVSPSVYALTGETPEEYLTISYKERYTEESLQRINITFLEELENEKDKKKDKNRSRIIEVQQYKKDRSPIWVAINVSFMRSKNGKPIGIQGISRNINDQKLAEDALRKSEEQLRLAITAGNQGLYDFNIQTEETKVNDEYAIMLGYKPGEIDLSTTAWMDRLHPEDKGAVTKHYEDFFTGLIPDFNIEFRQRNKQGNWVWVLCIGKIVEYDIKGKPLRMIGTYTDISPRKKFEQELKISEEKYRLIFERSPLGLFHFDKTGCISECNDRFVEIIGSSKDDIIGLKMKKLPDQNIVRLLIDVLKGNANAYEGIYHSTTAIKTTPIRLLFAPIVNMEGKVDGGIGLVEDRSSHVQTEEFKKQVEVARESAKFKQNFLANMSHEIRTPLTGVLGMIDILEQTGLNDKQREYLNILKNSGENLTEIINQVLDFSKIEAGKVNLKYSTFGFETILDDAQKLFKGICRKDVELNIDYDKKIPPYIKADRNRISQVVNNLVSNAVKFTHKGKITLRARLDSNTSQKDQVVIKIEVVDSGIGIPKDMQEKLFIPFSQIDENDIRVYEGTGLGLSICKELVNLHGGNIGVKSKNLQGSTFWFTFVAEISGAYLLNETESVPTDSLLAKKLRILFAEDKLVNQKVVKLMLESLGHEVVLVNDGNQAIDKFEPGKFDLILMDIQMPIMDGIAATKKLKLKFTNLPPIVGLSANAFEGDREKYMAMGMDDYLTKPVKRDDFHLMIQRLYG